MLEECTGHNGEPPSIKIKSGGDTLYTLLVCIYILLHLHIYIYCIGATFLRGRFKTQNFGSIFLRNISSKYFVKLVMRRVAMTKISRRLCWHLTNIANICIIFLIDRLSRNVWVIFLENGNISCGCHGSVASSWQGGNITKGFLWKIPVTLWAVTWETWGPIFGRFHGMPWPTNGSRNKCLDSCFYIDLYIF